MRIIQIDNRKENRTMDEPVHYLKKELYELVQKDSTVFEFIQNGSLDGLWYWDLEEPEHEWMNSSFWKLMGIDPSKKKPLASEWQDLIHPDDLKVALKNFKEHCKNPDHPYDQIVRYKHKDGSTVWVRCRGLAIRDSSGKPIRMLGAHNDLTELKKTENTLKIRNEELKLLAHYDSLTSLLNRHSFQEQFESQLRIAGRQKKYISLLLVDIDLFKQVNDRFGHLKGDEVLQLVSHLIINEARDSDIAARFGGEEFILLLPDTDEKGSLIVAERTRLAVENHIWENIAITVSVGASTFSGTQVAKEMIPKLCNELIDHADKALYYAKENGRNKSCHYNNFKSGD